MTRIKINRDLLNEIDEDCLDSDPFLKYSDVGIFRFLAYVKSAINDLEDGAQLNPDSIVEISVFTIYYPIICRAHEFVRTISNSFARKIRKLINRRKLSLLDTLKNILDMTVDIICKKYSSTIYMLDLDFSI